MKKGAILIFLTIVFQLVMFSQDTEEKEILILSIDNQEDILSHVQEHNGCTDIFYIKSLSNFSTLYGFKTRTPKTKGGLSSKKIKSFSEEYNTIKNKGRTEVFKHFSKYYIIFVEKEEGGGDDDYVYYDVTAFIMAY